ncbi:M48 family metallopeptidase [Halobaculum sp. P14]|uniref:M48 family metallopeptidase n=1 Tax=Halobaculum sp. P14 TaxID=3421638 RepID=UPI003EBB6F43
MTQTYHIGQTVIPYQIDWSDSRETIGLSLDDNGELTVRAPVTASTTDVEETLNEKQPWLLEKLYGLEKQASPPYSREFLSGETLPYKGRQYPLKVVEADVPEPTVTFDGHKFRIRVHDFDASTDHVSIRRKRQAVVDWYVETAKEEIPERSDRFEAKLGVRDADIEVVDLTDRWGEYEDGTVRLNWRLILAPVRIQDYVLVHELAHENHGDHSDAFWNTVGTILPDYRDRRDWLRINGNTLTV